MPTMPTPEAIAAKELVEGADLDFKREVDLDDGRQRSNLVDDVVAFLNARAGHIVIGVKDRGGAYDGFMPVSGDIDARSRRLLQLLQDNIAPKPLGVAVTPVAVEGGYLLVVEVPEHAMRPYQNRLNGAFYIRTGSKNTPIPREEIGAHFVTMERFERDASEQLQTLRAQLAQKEGVVTDGARLDVTVLPRAHYERGRPVFDRGRGRLKLAPLFHDRPGIFSACEGGHEVELRDFNGRVYERFFLAHDWRLHGHIVYPIKCDAGGHVLFDVFKSDLTRYLGLIAELMEGETLEAPIALHMSMTGLSNDQKLGWVFDKVDAVHLPRPALVERVDDPAVLEAFHDLVTRSTRWG